MVTPDEYLMQKYKVEVMPFARDDDIAVVSVGTLRDLAAQVEALQADAERLKLIHKNIEFDGSYWLPEWCVKECFNVQYAVAPSLEEFRAAIDARKDQP